MITFVMLLVVFSAITFVANSNSNKSQLIEPYDYVNIETAKEILGDYQGIVKDYDELIKLDPKNEILFHNRGVFKFKLNDIKGSLQDFSKSISINFLQIRSFVDRAFIKNILLDYNGAIQDYNTAINNFKVILENSLNDDRIIEEYELAFLYINRASLQIMIREFQCALIDCDISIKIEPEYGKAYLLRGIAKINLGNTEGARSDWLISGELGCFEAYDMIHKYFD